MGVVEVALKRQSYGIKPITDSVIADQQQVAAAAYQAAGIEPGQIDEIYVGQFNSGMMPLAFPSSLALQVSEQLANVPSTRVENACASGSWTRKKPRWSAVLWPGCPRLTACP